VEVDAVASAHATEVLSENEGSLVYPPDSDGVFDTKASYNYPTHYLCPPNIETASLVDRHHHRRQENSRQQSIQRRNVD
jgi:hypothetical protein